MDRSRLRRRRGRGRPLRGTEAFRIEEIAATLAGLLGDRVDTSLSTREQARADQSGHAAAGLPLCVVHAENVNDVQTTLRFANERGIPVVTRGAGTGLAGGANAGAGEIALSLARMNRILEVNTTDALAVVEPGIINAELNAQLAPHGLWWAPDPASKAISTVGGNIATGAGGLLCAKYGVVRDAVLALDVVLADGRLLHLGHRSVKGVTGLDLVSLFIGSEGTLGVVVSATLKLRRLVRGDVSTLVGVFPDVQTAAEAAVAVTASGVQPAVMELLDSRSLTAIHALLGLPLPLPRQAQLTIQTDGPASGVEAARIADLLAAYGEVRVTNDPEEGEHFLEVRRAMHAAMESLGRALIEDVSVPRSRMAAMFAEVERIEEQYGVPIPTVAHAGDGNLHPNFIFSGDVVPDVVWAAADDLFRSAIRLGGTLTGEHGIGVLKRRWLADELGEDQWQLQRQIARVFDPNGILNPGKVFEPRSSAEGRAG